MCLVSVFAEVEMLRNLSWMAGRQMVTVKSSQKTFTEEEISRLTGICLEHLRTVARSKHLGSIVQAAEAAGEQAERWLFSNADLNVLAVLFQRCDH